MPHIFAELDFVIAAYLVHPNLDRVLLVKHKKLGWWLPVGGHIEIGQTTDEALAREIKEETGLAKHEIEWVQAGELRDLRDVWRTADHGHSQLLITPHLVELHEFPPLPGHRHLCFVYFGRATTEQVRLEEIAHSAMHWFTREELGSGGAVELETVRTSCLMAMREVRHASEAR